PGLYLAPGDIADAIGVVQYDQRPAVIAKQPGLGPLPAPPLGITPAMPSVQACSDGANSQALEPGQVIFGHRPEGHQVAHGREFTTDSNGEHPRHAARPGARRTAHRAAEGQPVEPGGPAAVKVPLRRISYRPGWS